MRFVKEAIRLGVLMFAGQMVCEGLTKLVKARGGHWCKSATCCRDNSCQEITEKEDKKSKRKSR